jgi:hypothetical protein
MHIKPSQWDISLRLAGLVEERGARAPLTPAVAATA